MSSSSFIFSLKIGKSVTKSNSSHPPRQGVSGSLLPATCLYSALERYDQWSLNKYYLNLHSNLSVSGDFSMSIYFYHSLESSVGWAEELA